MPAIYTPILKAKQGELKALANTKKSLKDSFVPLIEVPPIPPKYLDGEDDPVPSKSIAAHVTDTADKLIPALADINRVLIDGFYVEEDETLESGLEPIEEIFRRLRAESIGFAPVIGLDRVLEYTKAVAGCIATDDRGCCLRINANDLDVPPAKLKNLIDTLLKELKTTPGAVDLLVDYGPQVPMKSALLYQLEAVPSLKQWRNVIFAASSFPTDMSEVAQNSIAEFERREWSAWSYLRLNSESITRMPIYGDYGINHPIISEVDPRIMRMSPNIRYTAPLNFVVAKGSAYPRKNDKTKKANVKAADQYPKLAKMIMGHPSWKGEKFSWGHKFIAACSRKECVGNSTDWRAVGTCHHIALAVHQLSNLHEAG